MTEIRESVPRQGWTRMDSRFAKMLLVKRLCFKIIVDIAALLATIVGSEYATNQYDLLALALSVLMSYVLLIDLQFSTVFWFGLYKKVRSSQIMPLFYKRSRFIINGVIILSACVIVASPFEQMWPCLVEDQKFQFSDITLYVIQFFGGLIWRMADSTIIWTVEPPMFSRTRPLRFNSSGCFCPENHNNTANETVAETNIDVENNVSGNKDAEPETTINITA